MPAHSPPSPQLEPAKKRLRQSSVDKDSPPASSVHSSSIAATSPTASTEQQHDGGGGVAPLAAPPKVGQSSNFRNVSACNRCRLRKNRCDQKLPSCASCEKANVACVGYDPITKKEIPRSYVFYLETRVEQLETLLCANNIAFPPAEDLQHCSRIGMDAISARSPTKGAPSTLSDVQNGTTAAAAAINVQQQQQQQQQQEQQQQPQSDCSDEARLHKLVTKSDITHGKEGTANPRYLGSTSGVSFARVVFAAVQSSVNENKSTSDKAGVRPSKPVASGNGQGAAGNTNGTTMRDSFFGLHTKPTIHPAPFPDRVVGEALVKLYFEHANPQIPILHRVEFHRMFDSAYDPAHPQRGPKELYMLNMVFAIGSGIIMGAMAKPENNQAQNSAAKPGEGRMSVKQAQPEEYHASAIVHLEACLNNSGGGLEELQAVLLLATFALLRPVPPGLWYIVGVAVRLAVDLGLHYEDGKDVDSGLKERSGALSDGQLRERGRREFVRDLRRRLWWSTYSFDRLVSICVGRPFGISDQVITTEFPSLLEDDYITPEGFKDPPPDMVTQPTYKLVAHHYFRLRLLQSEILQVLQYQQAQSARLSGQNKGNPYMHTSLPSPFLSRYESFRAWRIDIDKRLFEWKMMAPTKQHTGVGFSTDFLDLNYWQAIVMLYRQSLSVPAMFEGEYNTSVDMNPAVSNTELREDEDRVFLKVAEAGQKIMRIYRQLHLAGLLNYTYLATHHIFMAGISYLYAIWHSPIVRSRLSMDEVDFTVLAATSVFSDLIDKCPPAEACRDAIDRTARATIRMANSTGGFGQVLPPRANNSTNSSSNSTARNNNNNNNNNISDQARDWAHRSDSIISAATTTTSGGHSRLLQTPQLPHIQNTPQPPYRMMNAHHANPDSDTSAIDPSLLPSSSSPGSGMLGGGGSPQPTSSSANGAGGSGSMLNRSSSSQSIAAFLAQQQKQQQLNASSSPFGNLQDMEFLQQVSMAAGGSGMNGGNGAVMMDESAGGGGGGGNVDLGFGLGWEGLHHDFSDGQQQYDLFDGFFFGGQQNGGGPGGATSGGL